MGITIGAASFPTLSAQPFGYEESDTRNGRTARKWEVAGLLTPSEWLDLLSAYDAWRDLRIEDTDTLVSGVIGTTISFSGSGPGGQTWTNIDCWFISAPNATANGAFLNVTVGLIDANEALEVLLKEQEAESEEEDLDLGTITIGTTVLKLLKPVDTYASAPSMELTASGTHFISGSKIPYRIKDVEGRTDLTGWNDVRTWYESSIAATPSTGDYFPISAPTASAESIVISGVKSTAYIVSIQLGEVI